MRKSAVSKLVFLLIGFLVMVGLNSMRQVNRGDSHRFKAELGKPTNEFVIDLAQCGLIKYYMQPNVTSVYIAMQPVQNNDKGQLSQKQNNVKGMVLPSQKYTYKLKNAKDISIFVSQNSKKGIWTEAKENTPLKLSRRGVPLNLEVEIPRNKVYCHDVAQAQIDLLVDGVEKTTINLKVINSKY